MEILKEFTLCNPYTKCGCPKVMLYADGKIIITDDYDNKVETDINGVQRILELIMIMLEHEDTDTDDNVLSIIIFSEEGDKSLDKELKMTVYEFRKLINILSMVKKINSLNDDTMELEIV